MNLESTGTIAPHAERPARTHAAAISEVVDADYARLYRWLCGVTGRPDVAADLTQATFAAYCQADGPRSVRKPTPWLFRTARRIWTRQRRDQKRRSSADVTCGELAAPALEPGGDETARVRAAVVELPASLREPLVLRYWCDMSERETAAILGLSIFLVRWRVHRARGMIEARLRDLSAHERST